MDIGSSPVPLLTEGDVVQIEVSRRLVFKPSEGKVTLKGGRCPQSPVCGGGYGVVDLSSAEWWKAMIGLVQVTQESKQRWRTKKRHQKDLS